MTEADFRDWVRGQLSGLEGRVRAVEGRPDPGRLEVSGKIKGDMNSLAEKLLVETRAGRVAGLAIAYLTEDGTTMTGWVEGALGAYALSGAAAFVGLEMLNSVLIRENAEAAA